MHFTTLLIYGKLVEFNYSDFYHRRLDTEISLLLHTLFTHKNAEQT